MQLSNESNHVFVIFGFVASDVPRNEKSQMGRIILKFLFLSTQEISKTSNFL